MPASLAGLFHLQENLDNTELAFYCWHYLHNPKLFPESNTPLKGVSVNDLEGYRPLGKKGFFDTMLKKDLGK